MNAVCQVRGGPRRFFPPIQAAVRLVAVPRIENQHFCEVRDQRTCGQEGRARLAMQLSYTSVGDASLRRSRQDLVGFRESAPVAAGRQGAHHLELELAPLLKG